MDLIEEFVFDYFLNLEPLLLFFWIVAFFSSLIFIGQAIMSMFGFAGAGDLDPDFDGNLEGEGSSFSWLSFRNIINFLLGFSWAGVVFYNHISSKSLLVFIALIVGLAFVAMFVLIMRQFRKLEENNTFQIQNTIDKTAQVYLTIPAMKQGKGKVHISINGSLRELDALTEADAIETGAMVKVVKIVDGSLIYVEKL